MLKLNQLYYDCFHKKWRSILQKTGRDDRLLSSDCSLAINDVNQTPERPSDEKKSVSEPTKWSFILNQ